VVFRQWNEEVKAFSAERTDHTFTEAVGFGISWRGPEYSKAHVRNGPVEHGRENAITVMDEKAVTMV
jgi:hypothetical protein